jgi:hypothetical protein
VQSGAPTQLVLSNLNGSNLNGQNYNSMHP